MDKNKLKVLQDIDYMIHKTCGVCIHSNFRPNVLFGTCMITAYKHLKHSGEKRDLSIHFCGSCERFESNKNFDSSVEHFKEFVK